jgi:hypothetical protein
MLSALLFWQSCTGILVKRRYRDGYHFSGTGHSPVDLVKNSSGRTQNSGAAAAGNSENSRQDVSITDTAKMPGKRLAIEQNQKRIIKHTHHFNGHQQPVGNVLTYAPAVKKDDQQSSGEKGAYRLFGLLAGLLPITLLITKFPFRKLSEWAARNIWTSRFLITISSILLGLGAYLGGGLMAQKHVQLPAFTYYSAMAAFMATLFLYPAKHGLIRSRNYPLRKLADTLLLFSGLTMICFQGQFLIHTAAPAEAGMVGQLFFELGRMMLEKFNALFNISPQISRFWLVVFQIILTLLIMAAALFLLFLVAAISCNLSCSGNEGLALVVAIGGAALVVLLSTLGIRALFIYFRQLRQDQPYEEARHQG